ncbi:MAG: hypothetical protein RR575_00370 [Acinetobacter sp.]
MATVPQQSSLVTDEQAYTIECDFCTAKAGEQCINVRSITDSSRELQYYSSGVHKARIKAYKALNNVEGIEQPIPAKLAECPKPVIKSKTPIDTIYVSIEGVAEPLPVKVKTVEIYAVVHSTEKAIQVENSNQYTTWIPKSVIISSSRNVLYIKSNFEINWIKTVTE